MTEDRKFDGILVFEENPDIFARNREGRVLFRFNTVDSSFAVFRSSRMTDDEKEFCLIMLRRLRNKNTDMTDRQLTDALNYNLKEDLFCT